jgi:hypothetical protein
VTAHRAAWRLALPLLCGCPALAAQAAPDRSALQLFRDSLGITRDTSALHSLEARLIDAARVRRDDPLLHLRLGFVALRIHDLGGSGKRVEDAAGEFEWATQLQPGWPYPWLGLGMAEASMPDRVRGFAGGLWTMLGIDRDARAAAAYARSVKSDPGFVDGLLAFAELARSERIGAPVTAALDALREVQASPLGWDPDLLLERGRLERLAGYPDSARIALQRAALVTLHPAIVWLELARTLPLTSDTLPDAAGEATPAEVVYFRGAASDDPEVVAMYRRDLEPIVSDSILRQFDGVRGDDRVAWLRTFWRDRAAADLHTVGERINEHFRRWDFALKSFRLPPFRRIYRWGVEIYHGADPDLDDRGIVWLRQGAPTRRIIWSRALPREKTTAATVAPRPRIPTVDTILRGGSDTLFRPRSLLVPPRQPPGSLIIDAPVDDSPSYGNETWRYVRPDGDVVVHFVAREDPDDYHLVESILQLDVAFGAMAQHERELPGLAALLNSGPMARAELAQEERLRGRRNVAAATTTSTWYRSYPIIMGGRVQWFVAGTRQGMALVHVVLAVDATSLRIAPADPRTGLVPLDVRAVFLDEAGHPMAALDTIQLMHRPAAGVSLVAARLDVAVPHGPTHMRLNVEATPRLGVVYPLDSLVVPDVAGPRLDASSILIGSPGRSLPWPLAPGDTAWISAQDHYSPGDTLAIYLEAYGIRPGQPYSVHIGLVRQQGALTRFLLGRRESIALRERQIFPGPVATLRRGIALRGVPPGTYQLEVVIEGGGERVVRRRSLHVDNLRM